MKLLNLSILFVLFLSNGTLSMESILDSEMSRVTGQAGITIETSTNEKSSIGELRYEDFGEDKLGGSLSIRTLEIDDISSTLVIDVSENELIFQLTKFATTDMNIAAVQFGYDSAVSTNNNLLVKSTDAQLKNYYGSLGSIAINDYTLDESSKVSFKFNTDGQIALNAFMPSGSYFYFTYVDDGNFEFDTNNDGETTKRDTDGKNYLHTRVSFTNFDLQDIKLEGSDDERGEHLRVSLSSIKGGMAFEDISINGKIAGSIGFDNIFVEPVSYMKVRGY